MPTAVAGGPAMWLQVASGDDHNCAIAADETLWCWGRNQRGQLGDGSIQTQTIPTQVGAESGWTALALSADVSCAVRSGALWCWGANGYSQLGLGTTSSFESTPQLVDPSATWLDVAVGYLHACAQRADSTLHCWGRNNSGQLGVGDTEDRALPTRIDAATDWSSIATAGNASCGLQSDGSAWCWGTNGSGQLGLGDLTRRLTPTPLAGDGWQFVAAGFEHRCGIRHDGVLACWGLAANGQLGTAAWLLNPTNVTSP